MKGKRLLKTLASAMVISSLFLSCQRSEVKPEEIAVTKNTADMWPIFKFQAWIARSHSDCTSGWGICRGTIIIFGHHFLIAPTGRPVTFTGHIEPIEGEADRVKNFVFDFESAEDIVALGSSDQVVEITEPLEVTPETVHELGYQSMTLLPGDYPFEPKMGEKGGFKVKVAVE